MLVPHVQKSKRYNPFLLGPFFSSMAFYRTRHMQVNFTELSKQMHKAVRISKYRIFIVLKYFRILRYCF